MGNAAGKSQAVVTMIEMGVIEMAREMEAKRLPLRLVLR